MVRIQNFPAQENKKTFLLNCSRQPFTNYYMKFTFDKQAAFRLFFAPKSGVEKTVFVIWWTTMILSGLTLLAPSLSTVGTISAWVAILAGIRGIGCLLEKKA